MSKPPSKTSRKAQRSPEQCDKIVAE